MLQLQHGVIALLLLITCALPTYGQLKVSGVVLHPDRKTPVVGAGISRLGTGIVTTTDQTGRFSILAQPQDSIFIRAVGFKPILYRVRQEQELIFVLQEDVQQLREVEVRTAPILAKRPRRTSLPSHHPLRFLPHRQV